MAAARNRKRNRVHVELDDDVLPIVGPLPQGKKREYLNRAVRRLERPPYRLHIPERRDVIPISPLLEDTDHLILVGMTLKTIPHTYGDTLRDMAAKHKTMEFLVMNPNMDESSPLSRVLERVLGGENFVHSIRQQGRASLSFFAELRDIGREHGTRVDIRVYEEVPMCGLVITDPYTERTKMRINIYSTIEVNANHPVWDIDPASEEGRAAYGVYYRYYEQLRGRSDEV